MKNFIQDAINFVKDMPTVFKAILVGALAILLCMLFIKTAKYWAKEDKRHKIWGLVPIMLIIAGLLIFITYASI